MLRLCDFARCGLLLLMFWFATPSAQIVLQLQRSNAVLRNAFPSSLQKEIPSADVKAYRKTFTEMKCKPTTRYRSIDGSCNNLDHPEYGTPLQPFMRLIKPAYDDGKCKPRLFRGENSPLPSARDVSRACTLPSSNRRVFRRLSQAFMQWGQFLDHDITLTPQQSVKDSCKGIRDDGTHPDYDTCGPSFPIPISSCDPTFRTECMKFVRSTFVDDSKGVKQQMNALTAYIDGSNVYGSDAKKLKQLRDTAGGFMKLESNFLPAGNSSDRCILRKPATACFNAGDSRVLTNPGLAAYHTIFVREHNRIARKLAKINPKWNDERLFQETRRIIGAYMQHITYCKWLPILLGRKTMKRFGLLNKYRYDENENPNLINSFSTAAFRMGHSMLADIAPTFNNKTNRLEQTFFRPHLMLEGNGHGIDAVTSGLLNTKLEKIDRFFTTAITERLFQDVDSPGERLDLISLNIQRGRDHGIPAYERFKKCCAQFRNKIRIKPLHRSCRSVYRNRNDMDLFIGGVSEHPVPGGLVGPTFACIIAMQFQKLRNGDRFFYETRDQTIGFMSEQLREIKKVTLSRIICDNTRISEITPNAFLRGRRWRKKCSNLPQVDLSQWKENL